METILTSIQTNFPVLLFIAIVLIILYFIVTLSSPKKPTHIPTQEELRKLREKKLGYSTINDELLEPSDLTQKHEEEEEEGKIQKEIITEKQKVKKGPSQKIRFQVQRRLYEPIRTVQSILEWTPSKSTLLSTQLSKIYPLSPKQYETKTNQKLLLVVHDMSGNYAEDSYVDGFYSKSKKETENSWVWGYRPCHFHFMEAFVYFSHNLLSIPPRGWIDAAHRHGTRVLGTFLTEWEAGKQFCNEIFNSKEITEKVANKLLEIKTCYKFDGWLINIENKLEMESIPNLFLFLEILSDSKNNCAVIWYDSVISENGDLKWQNCLNSKNIEFFKRAKLWILTNYGWDEALIQVSNNVAKENGYSNKLIWQGIDIFGRGTFGGGGFHCDTALNLLDRYQSDSACLFAPGWVLEVASEKRPNEGKNKEREFWNHILNNTNWGENIPRPQFDVTVSALFTDFCDGGGACLFFCGEKHSSFAWLDLRRQLLQPRFDVLLLDEMDDSKAQKRVTIRVLTDVPPIYSGNSVIQLVGRRNGLTHDDWSFFPLLSLQTRIGGPLGPASMLKIVVAVLPRNGDVGFSIEIAARDPSKQSSSRLILTPKDAQFPNTLNAVSEKIVHGWLIREWNLKTQELRGRKLVGFAVSPLPILGFTESSWLDVRVGFVSFDETGKDHSICKPFNPTFDPIFGILTWSCTCQQSKTSDACSLLFVHVFVNEKFQLSAHSNECCLLDKIDGKIVLKGMRCDGSPCEEVVIFTS